MSATCSHSHVAPSVPNWDAAPVVSVIIPAYNHAQYIGKALESAFAQSFTPFEVIVVNDGSTDDTLEVLKPWVTAGKVRLVDQPNAGQSAARNRGVQESSGQFIAFLDDDDWWPQDKLEWQVTHLKASPESGLVSGIAQRVTAEGARLSTQPCREEVSLEGLFRGNPFLSPGQLLIRRSTLLQVGGLNASIWGTDDWDLWMRIAAASKVEMIDRVSLYYRVHAGNASRHTARMLKGSCATIASNTPALPAPRRDELSQFAYMLIFDSLARPLIAECRQQLLRGRLLGAVKSLSGISPLGWRRVAFDTVMRRAFIQEFALDFLQRRWRKLVGYRLFSTRG